ncbi:ba322ab6-cabc-4c17-89f2-6995816ea521 [Sclerotinia trifoliorum]|uniref:Ba322ab6-cabc-4c17-89f2-6995816ea521 n=1 Tax=Sclerotinia trifoliorum TaxID=28548 RepID=A0A8H2VSZ9_9HELO|nr:ba322ab6-cabc-4c17-89f2-6995816ea521 [Sclerotinia trifoliorum]
MPNWKTYEASVRLLSAIVAAHPNLKLDYNETSKYYGDESNYHQIWTRMTGIKRNAEQLRKAVEAGVNPSTVNLEDGLNGRKEISVRFGGDCTASAIDNRFRRLKSDAKLINAAIAKGEDPIFMNVGDTNGNVAYKGKGAISELMGSATPASHIQSQHRETIKPLGERLIAMRDAGEDCKDVDLTDLGCRRYKAVIAQKKGSDVTPNGIKAQFSRSFKVLAARKNALFDSGEDPKDASLDNLEVAKYMGSDVTALAVKMRYSTKIRVLSRRQIAMVDAGLDPLDALNSLEGETARIMGSDTTASSLKHHFQRTVKLLGRRQMSMLAEGNDSKDVSLDKLGLSASKGEIVAIMGSDVSAEAIKQQIGKRIKVIGSRQTKMRAAGQDPKDVDLEDLMPSKRDKSEMDKLMGDCTSGGIRFQFDTRYKVIGERQKAMLAAGQNPSTVDIVTSGKTS